VSGYESKCHPEVKAFLLVPLHTPRSLVPSSIMSSALYHLKQNFTLGAYKNLLEISLPDENSPEYAEFVTYKARAYIALGNPRAVASLVPADSENVALKAVLALAKWTAAPEDKREELLEQLRDIVVELEGQQDKDAAKVLAGQAFAAAGETEEALETLGVGTQMENLEAYVSSQLRLMDLHAHKPYRVAYIAQIYLSINRPDLAKAQFESSKRWAEDDLLLQLIEAHIGLASGRDSYSDPLSFYTEQAANPSFTSPQLFTARGVVRMLRGDVADARSDFEEATSQLGGLPDAETAVAAAVAADLAKAPNADEIWA
jgi:coatomer protein complex subunit epsilon